LYSLTIAAAKPSATAQRTRPSGRFGPAIDGTTSAKIERPVSW